MSGESRRARRSVAVVVSAAVMVSGLLAGMSGARAEPSTADIQWAQTVLKEKGFNIGGRANGQMTPQTRAAISGYQKSVGLPANGQLDQATVSRMMGDREKKAAPTMGSLSKSQIGQTPRDREVVPRAAPTQRIDSGTETVGGMAQFGSAPVPSAAPSSSSSTQTPPSTQAAPTARVAPRASGSVPVDSSEGPVPQAAPRAAVSAATPAGQPAPTIEPSATSDGMPGWMTNGLRAVVAGLLAATLGGVGFAWWRSGRGVAPAALPTDPTPRDTRREPSFGGTRRESITGSGPRLTAEVRRR